jgi:SPX domain protein involved in polyphosphate accumulation
MQGSRFEQKYIISEEKALQVRDFVRARLELDEHGVGKPNWSYPVHSVYLDSDDLKLYWSTINDNKGRYKLRLRFYDENPVSPLYFEIKQRVNKACSKRRAAVRRDAVDGLLAGGTPGSTHLVSEDPEQLSALEEFCGRMRELAARPKVHTGYFREAYMPRHDSSVRLTMDREVRAEPEPAARLTTMMRNSIMVWGQDVVLEMKFTDAFPDLFRELVSTFCMRQCGAAKYVDSVATLGEYRLREPRGG